MKVLEQLDKKIHNRKGFNCGVPALNKYLNTTARQHDTLNISRTFVLTEDSAPSEILGFYTLSVCHINWPELPAGFSKKYPKNGISAALIGRLAVDKRHQKQGMGGLLLMDAIRKVIESNSEVPLPAIVVDTKDDAAKVFYTDFGFEEISPGSNRMFVPTQYVKELFDIS